LVWSDRNGDGVCQAGETYAGVVVGLANSAEAAENALAGTRQVVTNTQGRYRFAGVTSGQYQLTFADPARRIPATSRTIDAAVVETSGVKVDLVYRWVYLAITSRRAP
jgi:hypothetical protein